MEPNEDWNSQPVPYQTMRISVPGDTEVQSMARTDQVDTGHDLITHGVHALAQAPEPLTNRIYTYGDRPGLGLFQELPRGLWYKQSTRNHCLDLIHCFSQSVEGYWSHISHSSLCHLPTLRPKSIALSTVNICIIQHFTEYLLCASTC